MRVIIKRERDRETEIDRERETGRDRERERQAGREGERNMEVLKRGWVKESITEMSIYLVS